MIVFYLIGFLLLCAATVILLGLTPESITDDLMRFVSPTQTLRDKVLIAKGKKKSRRLTNEILHIKDALDATGKGKQFTIACAASILLLIVGCIVAVVIDNYFMIPVLAVAFACLPFFYIKSTIAAYDRHVREEMETALSIITTSYIRSDDILGAVQENIVYLKPPVKGIFQSFVGDAMMISSDLKTALRNLKEKISDSIYEEWCDTLIACQDDRTLKDTLLPIVGKADRRENRQQRAEDHARRGEKGVLDDGLPCGRQYPASVYAQHSVVRCLDVLHPRQDRPCHLRCGYSHNGNVYDEIYQAHRIQEVRR